MAKTSTQRVRKSSKRNSPARIRNKTKKRKQMQSDRMRQSGKPATT